jgi:GAG-pre-integrase domain
LSVSKVTRELNCKIIFSPTNVIFQDQITGQKIGEGQLVDGLYVLDDIGKTCLSVVQSTHIGNLLHKRLGHPSDRILNKLFCCNIDTTNCDVCKLSK